MPVNVTCVRGGTAAARTDGDASVLDTCAVLARAAFTGTLDRFITQLLPCSAARADTPYSIPSK